MDQSRPVEEQYLLRVADPALAQRLGEVMRGPGGADLMAAQLNFNESDKHGTFAFEGREYPVAVLNLPCVTESYKTYDDINYVKTTDVGQMLLVGEAAGAAANAEAVDGVTPPMRNARVRLFRRQIQADPSLVSKVEHDLLTILAGGAPQGMKFVDHEEVWHVNPDTGVGEWVPVAPQQ